MDEIWWKEICPSCGKINWMWDNPSDETGYDKDGCKCWNCKHEWLIVDKEDIQEIYPKDASIKEIIENYAMIEDGSEYPE